MGNITERNKFKLKFLCKVGCKIYMPRQSVKMYKKAEGWSDYADMIEPYDFE